MQDAQEVMDMLVKIQSNQGDMDTDDPQVTGEKLVKEGLDKRLFRLNAFG